MIEGIQQPVDDINSFLAPTNALDSHRADFDSTILHDIEAHDHHIFNRQGVAHGGAVVTYAPAKLCVLIVQHLSSRLIPTF